MIHQTDHYSIRLLSKYELDFQISKKQFSISTDPPHGPLWFSLWVPWIGASVRAGALLHFSSTLLLFVLKCSDLRPARYIFDFMLLCICVDCLCKQLNILTSIPGDSVASTGFNVAEWVLSSYAWITRSIKEMF